MRGAADRLARRPDPLAVELVGRATYLLLSTSSGAIGLLIWPIRRSCRRTAAIAPGRASPSLAAATSRRETRWPAASSIRSRPRASASRRGRGTAPARDGSRRAGCDSRTRGPSPSRADSLVERLLGGILEVGAPDHEAVGRELGELVRQDVVELQPLAGPLRAQPLPGQRRVALALSAPGPTGCRPRHSERSWDRRRPGPASDRRSTASRRAEQDRLAGEISRLAGFSPLRKAKLKTS